MVWWHTGDTAILNFKRDSETQNDILKYECTSRESGKHSEADYHIIYTVGLVSAYTMNSGHYSVRQ